MAAVVAGTTNKWALLVESSKAANAEWGIIILILFILAFFGLLVIALRGNFIIKIKCKPHEA